MRSLLLHRNESTQSAESLLNMNTKAWFQGYSIFSSHSVKVACSRKNTSPEGVGGITFFPHDLEDRDPLG